MEASQQCLQAFAIQQDSAQAHEMNTSLGRQLLPAMRPSTSSTAQAQVSGSTVSYGAQNSLHSRWRSNAFARARNVSWPEGYMELLR